MRIRSLTVPVLAASFLLAVPAAHADPNGPDWYKDAGGTWQEAYIDEADGTKLHADVIRPAGLPANAKTPVILSIGPDFNHSGPAGRPPPARSRPRRTSRPPHRAPRGASRTSSSARTCSSVATRSSWWTC